MSRRARVLAVMGVVGAVAMVVNWCVEAVLAAVSGAPFSVPGELVNGALTGVLFALSFGILYAVTEFSGQGSPVSPAVTLLPLSRLSRGAEGRQPGARRHASRGARGLLMGFGGGLVYGAGFEVLTNLILAPAAAVTPVWALVRVVETAILFGVLFGLAAGAGFLVMSLREVPVGESPEVAPLRQAPVLALAESAGIIALGFLAGLIPGVRMPAVFVIDIGLIAGIAGTLAYLLVFTAWGQRLIMDRVALPLTRHLPGGS